MLYEAPAAELPLGLPAVVRLPARRTVRRICCDCGRGFETTCADADFCAAECRKAFNNRRLTRGAEIYDLLMALRYQRGAAKALGVWKLLCRMTASFRAEDERERAGRQSWRSPSQVLARHPSLRADVLTASRRKAA
jgi:hypothetical protein